MMKPKMAMMSMTTMFTIIGGGPEFPGFGATLCILLASTTGGKSMF